MKEYIEREAAYEDFEKCNSDNPKWTPIRVKTLIARQKSADVAPVRHGRWVLGNVEPGYFTPGGNRPWICSDCGYLESYTLGNPKESYCPNCGAKMDLEMEDA